MLSKTWAKAKLPTQPPNLCKMIHHYKNNSYKLCYWSVHRKGRKPVKTPFADSSRRQAGENNHKTTLCTQSCCAACSLKPGRQLGNTMAQVEMGTVGTQGASAHWKRHDDPSTSSSNWGFQQQLHRVWQRPSFLWLDRQREGHKAWHSWSLDVIASYLGAVKRCGTPTVQGIPALYNWKQIMLSKEYSNKIRVCLIK